MFKVILNFRDEIIWLASPPAVSENERKFENVSSKLSL